ncbi:efflux transporter outer membrane subunit [Azomonas macrocytogenes]|uniref:Multidrug efflux system outer membrane protein n=1 Tax=Azomonas macrocytogenes TaxID=69962 RepID=A0A839T607_AZOMA|nr:efflux transporter outer membrane subunit [Azomonas macrocytogenes]MBB3103113.1 multidrug efflux system outer membrane protein [Azomonas macrocytogenes]
MRQRHLWLAISCALALPGCSLIPDYRRPDAPVAGAWPQGEAYRQETTSGQPMAAELGWQQFFRDPALQRMVRLALENNRDLRQAVINVEAYRALYRTQRSELFPQFDTEAVSSRQRWPADYSRGGGGGSGSNGSGSSGGGGGGGQTGGGSFIQSHYSITLGTSTWEADLFGRIRSLTQAALEDYLATEETWRSVHIALVGDVATAYFAWRTDQALLELTKATLASYQESLALIDASESAGVASQLDVRQAHTLVDQARAQKALYTRQIAEDANALQLLLGGAIPADLPPGLDINGRMLADFPAGLPSDLLLQRPDIRAAEHRLLAANANIGAARAAFFPTISLTARAGTASRQLDGLFDAGSGTWSFVPTINLPIFTFGRLEANLEYAKLRMDADVARYEYSIQTAFRDVANGLAARGTYGEQLQAQGELVDNNQTYYELARQRYDEGVDNYLTVLDAQRELFTAQQRLLSDRLLQLDREVGLYKALGGGWQQDSVAGGSLAQATTNPAPL